MMIKSTVLLFISAIISCSNNLNTKSLQNSVAIKDKLPKKIITGANQTSEYLTLIQGKNVGIVANQTSVIFKTEASNHYTHLVDSLLVLGVNIKKVFAPEHGFRGHKDAGEHVKDDIDIKTGLPIISLYGKNKKPTSEQLKDIDVIIFDIQDVGARFYTYISSLHYVLEACAESHIPVIILDRPNPNGHYVDGPVLDMAFQSFVGMHPVPVVHGMTIGEYAKMIVGEKWLSQGIKPDLTVIPNKNYNRHMRYHLPIKPSPNLPNDTSINLYPSLCFFEGTNISIGRGTAHPFQVIGAPYFLAKDFTFSFSPKPNDGAKSPKHNGELCYGYDLQESKPIDNLNLQWLIDTYNYYSKNTKYCKPFFNAFFTKLAGTKTLQEQIESGFSELEIRKTWSSGLKRFKQIRKQYLLY